MHDLQALIAQATQESVAAAFFAQNCASSHIQRRDRSGNFNRLQNASSQCRTLKKELP
ncbi:hypothetical protein N0K08_09150 [Acidovorax sp. Be4]|uniref:Uncharacterized protein n=1 Tax=Acidovorax bellezanensis TaxID=2976702 RepID=A0ABT2PJZ3_9BURK|nr:hypothetical protein [Acidovorax sp. Be4]MCT9810801.1 hypothetical protein [Acidovorax sp. Be4]